MNAEESKSGWSVRLNKHRATWSWFTGNPQGGGFGSNQVSSQKAVLARATRNIPEGATYELTINDKSMGTRSKCDVSNGAAWDRAMASH